MDLTGWTEKGRNTEIGRARSGPQERREQKKMKKKGTWNRKTVVTTEPLEHLHCICQGSVQSSAFINLLWTWCFLISKTAGSFCESRKKAIVKQEGAGRRLPINSLGLSYTGLTNAKWSPWAWDEDTCPGHSGSAPYPFDSAEQLSFLFRAGLAPHPVSGTPIVHIPLNFSPPSLYPLLTSSHFCLIFLFPSSILSPRLDI